MTKMMRDDGGSPARTLDRKTFLRIARLAFDTAGLNIPEGKRAMVQSRLSRRLRVTGHNDFASYLDHVEAGESDELDHLISALTTNVSHFFREEHHYETLRNDLLPRLLDGARKGKRVRFWSAGCSTGQEPYTLAMILHEAEPGIAELDVKILATDIDLKVLATAQAGRYDARQVASVPEPFRIKYFSPAPEDASCFDVSESLRNLVTFRRLNLVSAWPMSGRFDAIFCRNVVIYFSDEAQTALWPRLNRCLTPNGYVFLGHSERFSDPGAHGFEAVGVTTYRRTSEPEAPPTLPVARTDDGEPVRMMLKRAGETCQDLATSAMWLQDQLGALQASGRHQQSPESTMAMQELDRLCQALHGLADFTTELGNHTGARKAPRGRIAEAIKMESLRARILDGIGPDDCKEEFWQ